MGLIIAMAIAAIVGGLAVIAWTRRSDAGVNTDARRRDALLHTRLTGIVKTVTPA